MSNVELYNGEFNITVAAGGGAGSVMGPGLLEALGPRFNVSVVVPTGDSGSKTGEIRQVFGGPAVGDSRKVLAAVSGNEAGELFDARFGPEDGAATLEAYNERMLGMLAVTGAGSRRVEDILGTTVSLGRELPSGLKGHTYGNLVLTALRLDHGDDLGLATEEAALWLDARARVIPVTTESHTVCLQDGERVIRGEGAIDEYTVRDPANARVWLENEDGYSPTITRQAYRALAEAGKLIIGPGSHFTSLLPVELPEGVADAIAEQRKRGGMMGTVVNLVAEGTDAPQMTVADHMKILEAPLKGRRFDFAVYNQALDALPEGRVPIRYDDRHFGPSAVMAIGANLVDYDRPVRTEAHDPIAHLRSPVRHRVTGIVEAMQANGLLSV